MRRMFLALVLVCGFCLPLATFTAVGAEDEATGAVAFTVHAAYCPIEDVQNPDVGLYDACHGNALEGVVFTFDSVETGAIALTTDAGGVGVAEVLDGITAANQVTLTPDPSAITDAGSYVYCEDQIGGLVLFDGTVPAGGSAPLFTVDRSQEIVCDWFVYGSPAVPAGAEEAANG